MNVRREAEFENDHVASRVWRYVHGEMEERERKDLERAIQNGSPATKSTAVEIRALDRALRNLLPLEPARDNQDDEGPRESKEQLRERWAHGAGPCCAEDPPKDGVPR